MRPLLLAASSAATVDKKQPLNNLKRDMQQQLSSELSARTTSLFAPAGSRSGVFAMRCCVDQRGAQSASLGQ